MLLITLFCLLQTMHQIQLFIREEVAWWKMIFYVVRANKPLNERTKVEYFNKLHRLRIYQSQYIGKQKLGILLHLLAHLAWPIGLIYAWFLQDPQLFKKYDHIRSVYLLVDIRNFFKCTFYYFLYIFREGWWYIVLQLDELTWICLQVRLWKLWLWRWLC